MIVVWVLTGTAALLLILGLAAAVRDSSTASRKILLSFLRSSSLLLILAGLSFGVVWSTNDPGPGLRYANLLVYPAATVFLFGAVTFVSGLLLHDNGWKLPKSTIDANSGIIKLGALTVVASGSALLLIRVLSAMFNYYS